MRLFFAAIALLLMSSCSYHTGSITTMNASGNGKTYEYVDVAVGYSKVSYFLGIGGYSKDMLIRDAQRNMRASFPLKPNEAFENTVLDIRSTWVGPYHKLEAIVTADIVARDSSYNVTYGEKYLELISRNKPAVKNYFSLNERVVLLKSEKEMFGRIVGFNSGSASVFCVDNDGEFNIKNIRYSKIFKITDMELLSKEIGFNIGDSVAFNAQSDSGFSYFEGVVVGMNKECSLVRTDKTLYKTKTNSLKKGLR